MTRIPELEHELVAAATRLQSRRRRAVWPGARAALAAGAVALLVLLTVVVSGDNESDRRPQPAGAPPSQPDAAQEPARATVAVLNGTTVPGIAAALGDQVRAAGFTVGNIANFGPNQQLAESVVQYTAGHEREAAAVGRKLGIGRREPAGAESQELAGDSTVIVIAGADKVP